MTDWPTGSKKRFAIGDRVRTRGAIIGSDDRPMFTPYVGEIVDIRIRFGRLQLDLLCGGRQWVYADQVEPVTDND